MDTRPVHHRTPGWLARLSRPSLAAGLVAATIPATLTLASPAAAGITTPTAPPPITIVTPGANNNNGDIFIAPFGDTSTYANGPEIIDNSGNVIWFHPVPAGQIAADFRTQTYRGQPVLTW